METLLREWNRAPMGDPRYSKSVVVGSSETGWMMEIGRDSASGSFEPEVVRSSSTRRELTGLLLGLQALLLSVAGLCIQVCRDSGAALANCLTGGGPVHELCKLVEALDQLLRDNRMAVSWDWVPREDPRIRRVDAGSRIYQTGWTETGP